MMRGNETLFVPATAALATLHSALGCSAPVRDFARAQAGNTSADAGDNGSTLGGSNSNGEAGARGGEGGSSGVSSGGQTGHGGDGAAATGGGAPNPGMLGGGAGANTGGGGTAGALGACHGDTDCDDGKACNGVEKCTDTVCKPGTAPCGNADPIHCVITCAEGAGGPTCSTPVGVDADHDGYKTTACAANPGNDCDDGLSSVHPGATEICDGLDNDCNGKADIADGLKPSGSSTVLYSSSLNSSIAYSPTDNVFAVPLSKPNGAAATAPYNTYLYVLDATNTKTINPVALTNVTNFSGPTAIAWGGSDFGIAYGDDNSDIKFRRVASNGSATAPVNAANDGDFPSLDLLVSLSIARVPNGNWAIVWHEAMQSYHNVLGVTISAADVASGIFPIGNAGVHAQIASLHGGFGLVWNESGGGQTVSMSNRTAAFVSSKLQTLSTTTGSNKAVIASNGIVYGVAWVDATNLYFRTISDSGAAGCGPATIAIAGFVPSDIVPTKSGGFLIVSGSTKIEAMDVSSACVFGTRFTIDADAGTNVHIAGGGGNPYGLAWDDGSMTDAKGVQTRIFGANICD